MKYSNLFLTEESIKNVLKSSKTPITIYSVHRFYTFIYVWCLLRQYCFKVSLFSKFTKKGSPWNSIVAIKFMLEEEGWCTPSLHSLYHLMLLNMKCSPMSLFASDSEYIVFTISLFNSNLFLSRVSFLLIFHFLLPGKLGPRKSI